MGSKKKKDGTNSSSNKSFAELIFKIAHRFPLTTVFDDFLTIAIAACTQNPKTKLSHYEDEYLKTIEPYKDSELRFEFSRAFASLVDEMEERVDSDHGNDVLGEFFEQHISNGRNGQFFTPFPVCMLMSSITGSEKTDDIDNPLRIMDSACGSGRMLLAARRTFGCGHQYYGIDIDRICAKMAALNLFLNGMWNSEVMCANALKPDDFVIAYRISLLPLGIFKIEEKEHSILWSMHQNSFQKEQKSDAIVLDRTPFADRKTDNGMQLDLFGSTPQ
jgi:hypothetical protein